MTKDDQQLGLNLEPSAEVVPRRRRRLRLGVAPREAAVIALATGALIWGTWATHTILGLQRSAPRLAKVELAELVRDYVQAEARSGAAPDQITAQTGTFLKALGDAVGTRAARGEVVLLSNAVIDGPVPDITSEVRAEVYAHVAHPSPGQPQGLSPQMQSFLQQNGADGGSGK